MVKTYSLKADREKHLSKDIQVFECACPDGSDTVLVDDQLVIFGQTIRDYFGFPIYIDGYRTDSYNAAIGGVSDSDHITGRAWDIDVGRAAQAVPARTVAMCAEAIGVKRIGLYIYGNGQSWIHIGSVPEKLFWFDSAPGKRTRPDTFLPELRKTSMIWQNRYEVSVMQDILARKGFYTDVNDGKFWTNTRTAVIAFQHKNGLVEDGIVGPKTWRALFTK